MIGLRSRCMHFGLLVIYPGGLYTSLCSRTFHADSVHLLTRTLATARKENFIPQTR